MEIEKGPLSPATRVATPDVPTVAGRLGGQAGILLGGYVFTLVVGFPLQVYLARSLGATGLGIFSLLDGGIGIVVGLASLGLAPTLVRFIPGHLERREYSCIRMLVRHGALLLLAVGTVLYLAGLVLLPAIEASWPEFAGQRAVVIVAGALIPLGLISFFLQQGLRAFQEVRYVVLASSIVPLIVKAVLAVLLIAMGLQLLGYLWAVVCSAAIGSLMLASGMWRRLRTLPADRTLCAPGARRDWGGYAKVMYGNGLLGLTGQYGDRILLAFFAGVAPVGVLGVLTQLTVIPTLALGIMISVVAPMFAAAHARSGTSESLHLYQLATDWVVRIAMPMLVFFLVFNEPLLLLYGEEFAREGRVAFWILTAAVALNLATGPLGNLLNMSGVEKPLFWLNAQQTALTAIGYLAFVPVLGVTGAALNVFLTTAYATVRGLKLARESIGIGWWNARYRGWILPGLSACAAAASLRALLPGGGAPVLLLALAVTYTVSVTASFLQGLHEDDRHLLGLVAKKLGLRSGKVENGA